MSDANLLERLQANLAAVASSTRQTQRIGPFTAFVDPLRAIKYLSWALPDPGAPAPELAAALPDLVAHYRAHDRSPRIEHFEAVCPALVGVLEQAGWSLSERVPIMACSPDSLVTPPAADGLVVEHVGPEASDERIRSYMDAQREAFEDTEPITGEQVERWRERSRNEYCFAGLLDGQVVGTAVALPITLGVTEVAGVATRNAFRRRGIAGTLTAAAVAAAFADGAELAFLTAADDAAARIYERAGFVKAGVASGWDGPG